MTIEIINLDMIEQCTSSPQLSGVVGVIWVICTGVYVFRARKGGRSGETLGTELPNNKDIITGPDLAFAREDLESLLLYNTPGGPRGRANLLLKYGNTGDESRFELDQYEFILFECDFYDRDELLNISRTLCADLGKLLQTVFSVLDRVAPRHTSDYYELVNTFGRFLASIPRADLGIMYSLVPLHEQSTLLLTIPLLCKVVGCPLFFKFFPSLHKKGVFTMFMGASLNAAFYYQRWGLHWVRDIVFSPEFLLATPAVLFGAVIGVPGCLTIVPWLGTVVSEEISRVFNQENTLDRYLSPYFSQVARNTVVRSGYRGSIVLLGQLKIFFERNLASYEDEIASRESGSGSSETAIVVSESGSGSFE